MKKLSFLVLSLLFLQTIQAQTNHDTVFNDVILINKENVTTDGLDFLIDIPIKTQKKAIIIFNNDERIPTNLFFDSKSFLDNQNELFLITPDWKFNKEILERERREGIHIKAFGYKIYHIQRGIKNYLVDSLDISLHSRPIITLNFKKPELLENEIKYYVADCYGSSCCPRDKKWDLAKEIGENIKLFEDKNGVNVTNDIYRQIRGKEGEHCDYYPLSGLSNEQKLMFIKEIKTTIKPQFHQIHTPVILKK